MRNKYSDPLSEWQERNCTSCRYADKKAVGTGDACCTYYLSIERDNEGECKTARKHE